MKGERHSFGHSNRHQVSGTREDVIEDSGPGSGPCQTDIFDKLSQEQQELIKRIVVFQDKYELPSKEDMSKISVSAR